MTTEEKAKAYDKALKRARVIGADTDLDTVLIIHKIFPELVESKNEKIRQLLIHLIQNYNWLRVQSGFKGATKEEVLSYLEKQKPVEKPKWYDSMDEFIADALIEMVEKSDLIDRDKSNRIYWITKHRKPARWSEEDEKNLLDIDCLIHSYRTGNAEHELSCWLKSLRPQKGLWVIVDREIYIDEPVLAQLKDKSDVFSGYVVCNDHTLTPTMYERYIKISNISTTPQNL